MIVDCLHSTVLRHLELTISLSLCVCRRADAVWFYKAHSNADKCMGNYPNAQE